MSLNTSGPISLGGPIVGQSINLENNNSATAQVSLNDAAVRSLAGVPSGIIIMPTNFYGKSNAFTFNATISSNTLNYNLLTAMQAAGYTNGTPFNANVTIDSGVYVWSDSATPAFDTGAITGSGTINLTNNGFIIGKGGAGGSGNIVSGQNGETALSIQRNINIVNNSYIAGGGGGGVGYFGGGGGGAGGGNGGNGSNAGTNQAGGAGGGIGSSGSNGVGGLNFNQSSGGGGGGRILPGVRNNESYCGGGGAGGSGGAFWNRDPTINTNFFLSGGGGGGWGASGGQARRNINAPTGVGFGGNANGIGQTPPNGESPLGTAGSGGKAINLNGYSVTYITTGTIYGAVS